MSTFRFSLRRAIIVASLAANAWLAMANPPPPRKPDPISLDRTSPSVVGWGNTVGDIYGENPPAVFLLRRSRLLSS